VTLADSTPNIRGIEGPVRSISSTPTECPNKERDRASCVVTDDFPTPPLPDRTYVNGPWSAASLNGEVRSTHQHDVLDFGERHDRRCRRYSLFSAKE
jgi:hypothetical protein